ncbi:hypothetical protein [Candidatus Nitrososphaera evergladensis]|nr:hypothetical protein [Candidatus Nitrososphaera evergladensis]
MAIPQPLYYYALIGNTPGAVELYVHADGNDTPFEQLMDFKKSLVTYIVNIEKGTEQVMLGRRLP